MLPILTINSSAQVYRYQDAGGRIVYSDQRPEGAPEVRSIELRPNTVSGGPMQPEVSDRQVTMYSASWCGICKQARRYFEANAIDFTEFDIDRDARARRDFARLGGRGVPLILVDEQRMTGFDPARFDTLYSTDTR
jgi:glutaredoxin